jgi:tetratricopeptide (TPR) repeat protein
VSSYFKKFFQYARNMQDKIGICFALNRIAVGFYFQQKYELCLKFNLRCLEMIDQENAYSILYNIGIVCRRMLKFDESLNYFMQALEWSKLR